jgi:hypothetical protein
MVSIWLTKVKRRRRNAKIEKISFARRSRFLSNWTNDRFRRRLLAILLDAGGSKPGKAMLIDGELPGKEFVDRQRVAAASFLEGQQTAANRGYDFGLATDNPSLGSGCGEVRDSERTTVGPDDVFYPRAMGLCHGVLTNSQPLNSRHQATRSGLKFA